MSDNDKQTTPPPTPPTTPAPVTQPGQQNGESGDNPTWLPERLERAGKKAVADFMKEVGIEKAEDLKTLLADAKKIKDAQLTEAQRTAAELETARKKAEEAEKRATDLEAARRDDLIDSEIKILAKDARAEHPQDVVDFIRKLPAEELARLVGEDGKVKTDKVKALVEKAKTERPAWFASGNPGSPSNRGGKTPEPNAEQKKQASLAQFNHIKNRF